MSFKPLARPFVAAVVFTAISTTSGAAWTVELTPRQDGTWTSSLLHSTDATKDHTVGTYGSKREARKAARERKKELKNGEAEVEEVIHTGEECDNPLFNC